MAFNIINMIEALHYVNLRDFRDFLTTIGFLVLQHQ
jgi:hypothetical protein